MSSRRLKQFIYGLIYLLIFGGIVFGIYFLFLKPAPSCFDNVQNEGEQGVDCGGPCTKICIPSSTQPMAVVGSVYAFSALPGHVALLADVANPNSDFAAETFQYTFNFYDASGNVVQSVPGSSFIYADETKYLAVPNEAVSGPFDHVGMTIGTVHWVPAAQFGSVPQLTFNNVMTGASAVTSGTTAVSGEVTDADSASFQNIEIVAVLKAPGGIPAGVTETELDAIAPNQAKNFSVMYPTSSANIDPAATQVYAYVAR